MSIQHLVFRSLMYGVKLACKLFALLFEIFCEITTWAQQRWLRFSDLLFIVIVFVEHFSHITKTVNFTNIWCQFFQGFLVDSFSFRWTMWLIRLYCLAINFLPSSVVAFFLHFSSDRRRFMYCLNSIGRFRLKGLIVKVLSSFVSLNIWLMACMSVSIVSVALYLASLLSALDAHFFKLTICLDLWLILKFNVVTTGRWSDPMSPDTEQFVIDWLIDWF